MSNISQTNNDAASSQGSQTIIVHVHQGSWKSWTTRLLGLLLFLSVIMNFGLLTSLYPSHLSEERYPERHDSGDAQAPDKIAILTMKGTIMPPYSERLRKQIRQVAANDKYKGVLLVIDSPGGFVGDSDQIYHELKKLSDKKPVFVSMQGMAASGGYYIAMGVGPQGKIFAEPTTWTGSIGVIIPRYDISELADKLGIQADPLKTGEFKDALSPFRPMTDREREVWGNILNQAFEQFLSVIDENRNLDAAEVRALATGQVFTAQDALQSRLIDAIGFEEDALEALKEHLVAQQRIPDKDRVHVVKIIHTPNLFDFLVEQMHLGLSSAPEWWRDLERPLVPRALYMVCW